MGLNIDSIFGTQARALQVRSKRSEVIANNIANVDTPGFKARDVDFNALMQNASAKAATMMTKTAERHLSATNDSPLFSLKYRDTGEVSLDGNNVNKDTETVAFAENAAMYQASLTFLSGSIKSLKSAFRGE